MKLIFAQGNPEPDYATSRHNVGFLVLNAIAKEHELKWANKPEFHAKTTKFTIDGEKILLVKPTSYYNETGTAVRKILDYYKLDSTSDLLVVHDDLSLPFGTIRIRKQGSDAGNNGIKSINSHINNSYTRIKIGIKNDLSDRMDDADFVLAKFSSDETKKLADTIVPQVVKLVIQFINNTLEHTSYKNLE